MQIARIPLGLSFSENVECVNVDALEVGPRGGGNSNLSHDECVTK